MKRDYTKGMNIMKIKVAEKSTRILALIAAVITDRIGSFINFWRENRE
ncbi:hypothetical protein bcere0021_47520 [Bacillus cereus Rock3-42]|nr:hypothetical protein bcere0021_47520 [Bacillus cereus Rock3-42]